MNLRSASGTMILGIVAIVLVVLVSWMLLISPVLGDTSETNDAIDATQQRNRVMTTQVATLENQQRNLSRYTDTAAELETLFPPTADQPGFFAAVSEAATTAGIPADRVTALSPTAPQLLGPTGQPLTEDELAALGSETEDAPDVAAQTVSVTAEASYDQIQQLLAQLERMERAFVVTALSIDEGGEEGDAPATLTVSITGSTFVASPLAEPGAERASSTSSAG